MVYLSLIFPKLQGCKTLQPNPCSISPLRLSQLRTTLCFKMDDKTKPCCRKSDCAEIVQHQIRIASAALAIQIISLLCLAFWCGRQKKTKQNKKLDNGFHLPPSQTNRTSIGSTYCSGWCIENTASQHCRWQWSRSRYPYYPVSKCQFSPHNIRAGVQWMLTDLLQ